MNLTTDSMPSADGPPRSWWRSRHRIVVLSSTLAALSCVLLLQSLAPPPESLGAAGGFGQVLVLAIPAFLAGVLSFLSPCTLPLLPAYFAFTFQARRERIVLMTIAFFLGLATSLVALAATATALSRLLFRALPLLTVGGGLIVMGFGLLSLLGRGFGGSGHQHRRAPDVLGSYVYGATFALGWTACVGPILGALLTLLAAQGLAVLHGALLAFIYALGLGLPLILVASCYQRFGAHGGPGRLLRGRGWEVQLGRWRMYLHTTNILSGVLLIAMGALLASGQLMRISQWGQQTALAQWVLDAEEGIRTSFGLK
ncbi:MAG TPA: cytochrome c biogenesis CcdA family protein [Herpetosiphonaceae bacterium]